MPSDPGRIFKELRKKWEKVAVPFIILGTSAQQSMSEEMESIKCPFYPGKSSVPVFSMPLFSMSRF